MNIFVGNLSFLATENDVKGIFKAFGAVSSVNIKKKSGKNSRGFGFVSMPDDRQAEAAIANLQDKEFMGRPLNVSIERPKAVKPKKDYKEIKRVRLEAKNNLTAAFVAPIIPEKEVKPRKRIRNEARKFSILIPDNHRSSQHDGAQAWEKRKGRGTAKPWKKKPGGVNKKFKYAR
jgi:RNA recognition motif-containing protein